MQYRKLGKSALELSTISFGCMSLGTDEMINRALINGAIESGINLFDTADLYEGGKNEIKIGKLLMNRRKQVIISTKVGNKIRADGSGWDWAPGKSYILQAAEDSLRRLQTDYIDLYQLHGGTDEDPADEIIEAFEILQQQGKIRYYGISSIRPAVIRKYTGLSGLVSVMLQYSLLDRRPEESVLSFLEKENIGVLARGSIAKGLLVDKPAVPYLNYTAKDVRGAAAAVNDISSNRRSAAQTAIAFVLQHQAITSAVAGIRTIAQLEDIASVTDAPILSQAEIDELSASVPGNQYDQYK